MVMFTLKDNVHVKSPLEKKSFKNFLVNLTTYTNGLAKGTYTRQG